MIENLTNWARSIVMAVIIVSILEMLLPNNKSKKYVKMVMGIFILYNIISPFIKDKSQLSFSFDFNEYTSDFVNNVEVNQESMDKRLEELYIQEFEKDIVKKIEKQGYLVKTCKVKAKISENENETGISKIVLKIEKDSNNKNEDQKEENNMDVENKIVTQIQKIKRIDTNISDNTNINNDNKLEKSDIQNIKQFLIKEYEVNEKCLEIN